MLSLSDFFPPEVATLFTDRRMDFTLQDGQSALSPEQIGYLTAAGFAGSGPLVFMRQVHGHRVIKVTKSFLRETQGVCEGDALVTDLPRVQLAVRTADCLPIFLYDPVNKCIGLAHAGWKGTHTRIVVETLNVMRREWGTDAKDLLVAFGPSIHACCYEVGPEFREYFKHFPETILERGGRFYLDLPLTNEKQLLKEGVKDAHVRDCPICTCCREDCFSFRREKEKAGRHLSLIMLLP